MMRARVVSLARRVTLTSKTASWLTVPAKTSSPGALGTGTLSPVMGLWSTALLPATTSPSTGTRSPGRTMTWSPIFRRATGRSTMRSPSLTRAVLGIISPSALTALRARSKA